jgi:hypothetical protein
LGARYGLVGQKRRFPSLPRRGGRCG